MTTRLLMPKLGESVVEGTVARWLKQPGARVEKLEPLVEISTDKIDTEIPSPAAGVLAEILVAEGQTVAAGTVLALIAAEGEVIAPAAPASAAQPKSPAQPESAAEPETGAPAAGSTPPASAPVAKAPVVNAPAAQSSAPVQPGEKPAGRSFVSPVVKRIAAEHAVDLEQVPGTGLAGRITRQDLLGYLAEPPAAAHAVEAPAATGGAAGADELLHPLSTMRRTIAQHMVKSVQTAPHAATIFEVDMTAVVLHRERHKQAAEARGAPLTFTPYFVAAAAQALRAHPLVNSRWGEQGIIESRRVHVGVAVSLPGGLMVPVIRDADELSLLGLARAVADLAQRARSNGLGVDDLSGGTFTVTNHGVGGSLLGVPIIAQPQSAILGIGAIVKRPVVVTLDGAARSLLPGPADAIVIRPMAYLCLSFDHRLLDGAEADAFLSTLKRALESWPAAGL